MLYRQPRFSPIALLRTAVARLAGMFAAARQRQADAALIDSLDEAALRDLGIRRLETRDARFYD